MDRIGETRNEYMILVTNVLGNVHSRDQGGDDKKGKAGPVTSLEGL
jgi:hypothetical protein